MSKEHSASVIGRDLPISTKKSIEVCNFIRGKTVSNSKKILLNVLDEKIAIPFKRFNKDRGHKAGKIAAGAYPKNVCNEIIKLLNSVESNAHDKGLDTNNLFIKAIIVNKASAPWHYSRLRGRKMKRTHIEIIVEEREESKKEQTKEEKIQEQKKEESKKNEEKKKK